MTDDIPMECPFCGELPQPPIYVRGDVTGWVVWCATCGAQGPAIQGDTKAAKRESVAMWNKRASQQTPRSEMLKRLLRSSGVELCSSSADRIEELKHQCVTTAVNVTVIDPPCGLQVHCPTCEGRKELFAFMNTGEDWRKHRQGRIPCLTCSGTGEVDDGYPERLAVGKKMHDERVARGETLMAAATRMGMRPAELSALEHGELPRSNLKLSGGA